MSMTLTRRERVKTRLARGRRRLQDERRRLYTRAAAQLGGASKRSNSSNRRYSRKSSQMLFFFCFRNSSLACRRRRRAVFFFSARSHRRLLSSAEIVIKRQFWRASALRSSPANVENFRCSARTSDFLLESAQKPTDVGLHTAGSKKIACPHELSQMSRDLGVTIVAGDSPRRARSTRADARLPPSARGGAQAAPVTLKTRGADTRSSARLTARELIERRCVSVGR